MSNRSSEWLQEAKIISKILSNSPTINKNSRIKSEEFKERQEKVRKAIEKAGIDVAIIFSNEQYDGDVPYLAGNTNISVEPTAGVLGKNGFHILSGLEGGYVAEQLTSRSGAKVHKVAMLKLADEEYPIDAEMVEDVIEEAAGGKPNTIGLLTPRAVFPVGIYDFLVGYLGDPSKIIDAQELYYKIKYEKSENEMNLAKDACIIASEMLKCMLAVLKPGMLETQVAQWGYAVGLELGAEEWGCDVIVNANEANRSLIGKALNRVINEGDIVSLGVMPRRDGIASCERCSVVCTNDTSSITKEQKYWLNFIEGAYNAGLEAFKEVAKKNLPAKLVEQALIDYFNSKEGEVNKLIGKKINLARQKPYTGVHNSGYTECYEFYGAITLNSDEPLGYRILNMLDIAIRGIGNNWNEIIIPGLDFVVIEKTLGKFGNEVEVLSKLPINLQHLVGKGI